MVRTMADAASGRSLPGCHFVLSGAASPWAGGRLRGIRSVAMQRPKGMFYQAFLQRESCRLLYIPQVLMSGPNPGLLAMG